MSVQYDWCGLCGIGNGHLGSCWRGRAEKAEAMIGSIHSRLTATLAQKDEMEARVAELEEAINAAMTEIEDANSPYQPFRVAAILRATETL